MLKKLFLSFVALSLLIAAGALGGLYHLVVVDPGEEIELQNIRKILGKESHVFYRDGINKLGVFFDKNHRQYVHYNDIPSDFINALVAAEDNLFFSHFGFDPMGITRAAIKNFQAGRVVQGGSTLTQQTAKNLFKRTDRSLQAKLKELLYALRLEYKYSKQQIFEFYANQFYVSGNGHGLGVAARYYFDKKSQDLTLLECAFIAGSVKKPNAYNPFIKKSAASSQEAITKGRIRANYVLRNMYELDMIGLGRYKEELSKMITFKKGDVGFGLDYSMELVKEAVSTPQVREALALHGIDNIATSGIRIITSVDRALQQAALKYLRGELSRLDIRLRGYPREEVQTELRSLKYSGDRKIVKDAFVFGTVDTIERDPEKVKIVVSFGSRRGKGVIERAGMQQAVKAYAKWKKNRWSEADEKDLIELLEQIRAGDRLWTSVVSTNGAEVSLRLERYPQVQGGALVMQDGAINAVVGGTENRFFNRAVDAKRTMGSSFKPFLYAAAIQLGWNPADILQNKRELFVFQNQPYFPRPDHAIKSEQVSMSWAGVHSENVASIWLTAHLCDRLSLEQFREVAENVGMAPRIIDGEVEPYRNYKGRIRDKHGVVVNREILRKAAFKRAVKNLETDFIFEGLAGEYEQLTQMHYGLNFSDFREAVDNELIDPENKLTKSKRAELLLRKKILARDFLSMVALSEEFALYQEAVSDDFFFDNTPLSEEENGELYYDSATAWYTFVKPSTASENMQMVDRARLKSYLRDRPEEEREEFWRGVKLNSLLTIDALELLNQQVEREYKTLEKGLPYDFQTLASVDDFRTMVGLRYLIALAKELGVESKMEPVLSFPLGSNVVSLFETVRLYEGLAKGEVNFIGKASDGKRSNALSIIDRIESAEGRLLYEPVKERKKVFDARTALAVGHILENTVKYGTGRYADRNVVVAPSGGKNSEDVDDLKVNVPLLGKTGTANRYTNASFFGFLPGLSSQKDGVDLHKGYSIGVYVGYDNNMPMRRRTSRITGAAGALPTWTAIVNTLVKQEKYGKNLDPVELSFSGLPLSRVDKGQHNLRVHQDAGGTLVYPTASIGESSRYTPSILTYGQIDTEGKFVKGRHFEPFWRVETPKSPTLLVTN